MLDMMATQQELLLYTESCEEAFPHVDRRWQSMFNIRRNPAVLRIATFSLQPVSGYVSACPHTFRICPAWFFPLLLLFLRKTLARLLRCKHTLTKSQAPPLLAKLIPVFINVLTV